MGNKSKQRRRALQNQRKALKKLLASVGGRLYLNMDSREWQTGRMNGVDIRGHCVGYRVPRGTTPQEEAAMLKKWREMDAIFFPKVKPESQKTKPAPKPAPPKKKPKKQKKQKTKKLRLKVAEVHLELVGTEL